MKPMFVLSTVVSLFAVTSASGQQSPGQMHMSGSSGQPQSAISLPETCRTAPQAGGQGQMMQNMDGSMSQMMQKMHGMMGQMSDTQKGLHEAMMKMHGPMMTGAMAKDADVAWICAMIPHHQGAIDMARAGLKGADNAESKRLAEETIQMQEKEIAQLIAWVEKNAERENKNETTGSKK